MNEQQIQSKITKWLEDRGYLVVKLIKTTMNGIPDLLVLKHGTASFIEVKKPGNYASDIQAFRAAQLRDQGFDSHVIYGFDIDFLENNYK